MPVKTKTALSQAELNTVKQTPYLELKSRVEQNTNAEILEGRAVVIIDPLTGKALGATDFFKVPTHKTIAKIAVVAVQNTWYTVLDTTENCKVIGFGGYIGVADETVEGRITIDGVTILVYGINWTFATQYLASWGYIDDNLMQWFGVDAMRLGQPLIVGKSVKIEIRKTTANGANTLTAGVQYQVYE